MFRKSKPKVEPPPTAPSVEEMLEDMETFEIHPTIDANSSDSVDLEQVLLTEPENLSLQTWWKVFDEYDRKVCKLAAMEEVLESHKKQLNDSHAKLEKSANQLREGIKKQKTIIEEAIKC